MKKNILSLCIITIVAALAFVGCSKNPSTAKISPHQAASGTVSALDLGHCTMSLNTTNDAVVNLAVPANTLITKDGQMCTLRSLNVGDRVDVRYDRSLFSPIAVSVTAKSGCQSGGVKLPHDALALR